MLKKGFGPIGTKKSGPGGGKRIIVFDTPDSLQRIHQNITEFKYNTNLAHVQVESYGILYKTMSAKRRNGCQGRKVIGTFANSYIHHGDHWMKRNITRATRRFCFPSILLFQGVDLREVSWSTLPLQPCYVRLLCFSFSAHYVLCFYSFVSLAHFP